MISVSVAIKDDISQELKSIQKQLAKIPAESLKEFKALTPIRSGNARRNTHLSGDTIYASYPYAQRLDEGWSKQAPKGMTEPFEKWLDARVRKILGK